MFYKNFLYTYNKKTKNSSFSFTKDYIKDINGLSLLMGGVIFLIPTGYITANG